jgi:hypothetical protein
MNMDFDWTVASAGTIGIGLLLATGGTVVNSTSAPFLICGAAATRAGVGMDYVVKFTAAGSIRMTAYKTVAAGTLVVNGVGHTNMVAIRTGPV